eukprot:8692442-Pyramimonas_sp.AAC.1
MPPRAHGGQPTDSRCFFVRPCEAGADAARGFSESEKARWYTTLSLTYCAFKPVSSQPLGTAHDAYALVTS